MIPSSNPRGANLADYARLQLVIDKSCLCFLIFFLTSWQYLHRLIRSRFPYSIPIIIQEGIMEENMNQTRNCEYCGKDINIHMKVCPFCGGEVHDILEKELVPLCPRCHVSFEPQTRGGENYSLCPRCGGIWLDSDEFHQATKESDVYKYEDTHKRYFHGPMIDPVEYLPCVRCGKLMNRKNFAHISGIIIEECSSHGVWLDAGKLEKIRLFIVDGGLERAQDKRIESLSLELKDLASKADQKAFMMRLLNFWNTKRWLFGS